MSPARPPLDADKPKAADKDQAEACLALSRLHLDAALHYNTLRGQLTLSNTVATGGAVALSFRDGTADDTVILLLAGFAGLFSFLAFKLGQAHTLNWRKHELHRKAYERFHGVKETIHARAVSEFDSLYFHKDGDAVPSGKKLLRMWQVINAAIPLAGVAAILFR